MGALTQAVSLSAHPNSDDSRRALAVRFFIFRVYDFARLVQTCFYNFKRKQY